MFFDLSYYDQAARHRAKLHKDLMREIRLTGSRGIRGRYEWARGVLSEQASHADWKQAYGVINDLLAAGLVTETRDDEHGAPSYVYHVHGAR